MFEDDWFFRGSILVNEMILEDHLKDAEKLRDTIDGKQFYVLHWTKDGDIVR